MTRTAVDLLSSRESLGTKFEHAAALDAEVAALRARVAELEAPRSPSALELAKRFGTLWIAIHHAHRDAAEVADEELKEVIAALVAHDVRK